MTRLTEEELTGIMHYLVSNYGHPHGIRKSTFFIGYYIRCSQSKMNIKSIKTSCSWSSS